MPFYEMSCGECGSEFEKYASVSVWESGTLQCPKCGSRELRTAIKAGAGVIVKSDAPNALECPNRHICGDGCCHSN